jgi:hypothetical protein
MKPPQTITRFGAMLAPALFAAAAHAQTPAPTGAPAGDGTSGALAFVLLMVGLFALIALGVKVMDRRRKRDEVAVQTQARIADAVLLDPGLMKLPVSADAHVPFWGDTITIDVHGEVPTPALKDTALSLVAREASSSGLRFRVVDRLAVATGEDLKPGARRAA